METISPYKQENVVLKLSFEFALEIITYCESLEKMKKYNMANQLFRSGTSIHANVKEAQNSESSMDFIHKLKIAAKEAEETEGWLLLCLHSKNYPECNDLINKLTSILKLLNKIIGTIKRKNKLIS